MSSSSGTNPDIASERSREDRFKELELILEAKKNINSLVGTMYSVFFSLEGFLVYAYFIVNSIGARVSIAVFGAIVLVGLAMVTRRFQGTNDRCDNRARELETSLNVRVVRNYFPNAADTRPASRLAEPRMHATLAAVDWVLVGMWAVLAMLSIAGLLS